MAARQPRCRSGILRNLLPETWTRSATRVGALTAAVLIAGATPSSGDPISIVADSSFFSNTWGEESTLRLIAEDFNLLGVGFVRDSPIFRCQGCSAGTSLNLGSGADGLVGDGRVTIDNQSSEVFLSGRMRFSSGNVIVPDLPAPLPGGGATVMEISLPFQFHALLTGHPDVELTGPPVFSRAFRGRGTATVTFVNRGEREIVADTIMYDFGPTTADPVPEPATLLLTSGGLAAVAARRRRRNWQLR